MLRDALFFIIGLIVMYVVMATTNLGVRQHTVIKEVQKQAAAVIQKKPEPTPKTKNVFNDLARGYIPTLWTNKDDQKIAYAIIEAGSHNNCDWVNKTDDTYGLFEISKTHQDKFGNKPMTDCYKNMDVAFQVWQDCGWTCWNTYTNGEYKKYLKK